jgi:hypothetical protein
MGAAGRAAPANGDHRIANLDHPKSMITIGLIGPG